jgi:hypothetical protein
MSADEIEPARRDGATMILLRDGVDATRESIHVRARRRFASRPFLVAACLISIGLTLVRPAGAAAERLSASELERVLSGAEKSLLKAENALRKTDAGRVSKLLRRVDEAMAQFESGSGLAEIDSAFEEARSAASSGDLQQAAAAVRRARSFLPSLADYTVTRQAEVESRSALIAAESGDTDAFLAALEDFELSVLPKILSARVTEIREAMDRGRTAMVRRNMEGGREEVAAARRALNGLHLAGALSRTLFALRISSEMMMGSATLAAQDHLYRALRALGTAVEAAPDGLRAELDGTRGRLREISKRLGRPQEGDLEAVQEAARQIEASREAQS